MSITVSVRGQMVIPSIIRKKYKIGAGSSVELIDTGKEIILVPIPANSFAFSKGFLKGLSTKDFIADRRRERMREHEKR